MLHLGDNTPLFVSILSLVLELSEQPRFAPISTVLAFGTFLRLGR